MLLEYPHGLSEKRMTLTALGRNDVPHQGKDLTRPRFPIRKEGSIRGRQVDYL
jgi:hypothetical protein